MSRRILSVVVTVLGLVLVALAVCSATIWKPGSKVEAKLASGPSQPYVMTAPGVLSGTESDIAVTAKSSDGKDVHLFIARAADSAVLKVTDEPPVFSPSQRSEPEAFTALALRAEHCEEPACAEAEG